MDDELGRACKVTVIACFKILCQALSSGFCLYGKAHRKTRTSMRRAGLEPTVPVLEHSKTIRALDHYYFGSLPLKYFGTTAGN